jgi:hypothetical protein
MRLIAGEARLVALDLAAPLAAVLDAEDRGRRGPNGVQIERNRGQLRATQSRSAPSDPPRENQSAPAGGPGGRRFKSCLPDHDERPADVGLSAFRGGSPRRIWGAFPSTKGSTFRLVRASHLRRAHRQSQHRGVQRRLGLARAKAVCALPCHAGVKAKLVTTSRGESHPHATNHTTAGRARNRRVELSVAY